MALTDRVIREKHLTAMMVTHNLRYAVEYGDRILMITGAGWCWTGPERKSGPPLWTIS